MSPKRKLNDLWRRYRNARLRKKILQTCRCRALPSNGKTVLFWHHGGMIGLLNLELFFALALQFRGYTPHFILCDGTASACLTRDEEEKDAVDAWPKRCAGCLRTHKDLVEQFGFSSTVLGDFLSNTNLADLYDSMPETPAGITGFICAGKDLTENLLSGLIRYNKHGDLSTLTPCHIKIFAYDAACNWLAANEALRRIKPESVFMSHCIFTDFGPAYKAAIDNDIHVFGYHGAHKVNSMFFYSLSRESLVPGASLTQTVWEQIRAEPWDRGYAAFADKFYTERYAVSTRFSDMDGCLSSIKNNRQALRDYCRIEEGKPIFVFFSQIRWDASADFSGLLFATYDDFILASLKAMERNTRVEWLVKVHPAERNEPPIERTEDFIRNRYLCLPEHIKIIPPDAPFSPVDFFDAVDGAITACGTSGLEVAAMGKPVITAARFLYANRGFTYDAQNVEHFLALLDRAETLVPLNEVQKQLARKYLVTYLYRQGIPIAPLSNVSWNLPNIEDLPQLLPGKNRYIDLIMDSFENKNSPLLPFEWL